MIRTIKSLVRAWKARRDRKFRERIDRVYFRHDGKGNRFIRGHLYVVFDPETMQRGNITGVDNGTMDDVLHHRIALRNPIFRMRIT